LDKIKVKNILLVHGFWADASCYSEIIPTLLAEGDEVIAVHNPLTSLAGLERSFNSYNCQFIPKISNAENPLGIWMGGQAIGDRLNQPVVELLEFGDLPAWRRLKGPQRMF